MFYNVCFAYAIVVREMSGSGNTDKYTLRDATLKLVSTRESEAGFSGMFESSLVSEMAATEGKPVEELILGLLPCAAKRAFVPISNYYVGAVLLGVSGNLYFGNNIEIPGLGLGCSVHGEQSAFSNAFMHGEKEISIVAVNAAPCGHCRQFMTEFSLSMTMRIIIKDVADLPLGKLLPEHFGPAHLGNTQGAFQSIDHKLQLRDEVAGEHSELVRVAQQAANKSYAPYSKSPSGAALRTRSGRTHAGSYIESVAYNPSLPPLQAALATLIQSGESPKDIVDCAVAELENAQISQVEFSQAILNRMSHHARFHSVALQS